MRQVGHGLQKGLAQVVAWAACQRDWARSHFAQMLLVERRLAAEPPADRGDLLVPAVNMIVKAHVVAADATTCQAAEEHRAVALARMAAAAAADAAAMHMAAAAAMDMAAAAAAAAAMHMAAGAAMDMAAVAAHGPAAARAVRRTPPEGTLAEARLVEKLHSIQDPQPQPLEAQQRPDSVRG